MSTENPYARCRRWIKVFGQFEAIHCWPNAPEAEKYLRNEHRHAFFVELLIEIYHDDRELEFYAVKSWLKHVLDKLPKPLHHSCEMYAQDVIRAAAASFPGSRGIKVSVFEDNLEGSIVEYNC